MTDWPIREKSLNGEPKPLTSIERTCRKCGASFILTAPGKTHERGLWRDWQWYCSRECDPTPAATATATNRRED